MPKMYWPRFSDLMQHLSTENPIDLYSGRIIAEAIKEDVLY